MLGVLLSWAWAGRAGLTREVGSPPSDIVWSPPATPKHDGQPNGHHPHTVRLPAGPGIRRLQGTPHSARPQPSSFLRDCTPRVLPLLGTRRRQDTGQTIP